MKDRKILKFFTFLFFMVVFSVIFVYYNNNYISITKVDYKNDYIDDYTIVHISDLHNMDTHGMLAKKIKSCNPDIIVFTGDISDGKHYDLDIVINEMKQIVEIAPTYYVNGNHERWLDYENIYGELEEIGVILLLNDNIYINDDINLIGVNDPAFGEPTEVMMQQINNMSCDDKLNIILSHRPELFDNYIETKGDLFLTGHAHGGQWIIPFTKQGLYAPNQGRFPKYTQGIFNNNSITMIVNRGLGNSGFPLRLFNTPEIIKINLIKNK